MDDPTSITGGTLLFLLVMLGMMFSLPREKAIMPLLLTAVMMTIGPEITLVGCHFTILRLIILAGLIRIMMKREYDGLGSTPIDKMFFIWTIYSFLIGIIPYSQNPEAVMPKQTFLEAIINKGGAAWDCTGGYILARCFIREVPQIKFAFKILACLAVMLAFFMSVEKLTHRNMFYVLGAVPEFTAVRDGRLRCQGTFTHPIHAGDFGATLTPLCLGMLFFGSRKFAIVGLISATIVMIDSASSGPLMAWFFSSIAFGFWTIRHRMSLLRRSMVVGIIVLQICMKNPFWWVIARVSDIVGGGGFWRAKLIDQAVHYFNEWWLTGTHFTKHWSPTGVGLPLYPDMMDITNQFVAEGVNGGIFKVILFIWIIVRGFKRVGKIFRDEENYDFNTRMLYWSMGCMLVAYLLAFIDSANAVQNYVIYCLLFACMCVEPEPIHHDEESVEEPEIELTPSPTPSPFHA